MLRFIFLLAWLIAARGVWASEISVRPDSNEASFAVSSDHHEIVTIKLRQATGRVRFENGPVFLKEDAAEAGIKFLVPEGADTLFFAAFCDCKLWVEQTGVYSFVLRHRVGQGLPQNVARFHRRAREYLMFDWKTVAQRFVQPSADRVGTPQCRGRWCGGYNAPRACPLPDVKRIKKGGRLSLLDRRDLRLKCGVAAFGFGSGDGVFLPEAHRGGVRALREKEAERSAWLLRLAAEVVDDHGADFSGEGGRSFFHLCRHEQRRSKANQVAWRNLCFRVSLRAGLFEESFVILDATPRLREAEVGEVWHAAAMRGDDEALISLISGFGRRYLPVAGEEARRAVEERLDVYGLAPGEFFPPSQ